MRSEEDLRLAVKNGTYWLDENVPGWRMLADVNTLEMSSGCSCVLGQVFRNDFEMVQEYDGFGYGVTLATGLLDNNSADERSAWASENGFDIENGGSGDEWAVLAGLWREEIARA